MVLSIIACNSKTSSKSVGTRLKARFEIAGMCSNYTFTLIQGILDTSLVQASWTNPQTQQSYTNAFGLVSACDFPSDLKEGDEFYFELDNNEPKQCAICMAYYPVPEKKLNIKILEIIHK